MRGFVATDKDWWQYLHARPDIDEVNFWRPSEAAFAAIQPGEPFFFKLKVPHNAIGGFGLFARYARLPVWRAWEVFGRANGVADEPEFVRRLARLSSGRIAPTSQIGCIAVYGAVFFAPDEWVPQPASWRPQIVSGRAFDLAGGEGKALWQACLERTAARRDAAVWAEEAFERHRTGKPQLVIPRLGQASFRIAVVQAYGGACAVTTEHSLPVVDAAHIRPWSEGGGHELPNGLPLRRDLHRLYDLGYVTVLPDSRFCVSPRLREEYANGRTYYALEGRHIVEPQDAAARPQPDLLEWHNDVVFRR